MPGVRHLQGHLHASAFDDWLQLLLPPRFLLSPATSVLPPRQILLLLLPLAATAADCHRLLLTTVSILTSTFSAPSLPQPRSEVHARSLRSQIPASQKDSKHAAPALSPELVLIKPCALDPCQRLAPATVSLKPSNAAAADPPSFKSTPLNLL